MDIHKPKRWHGFHEFLKEYVIIVVGVLTALAAEAVVENLHERRISAEARDAVRAEIDLDLASLRQYEAMGACVENRLAQVERALAAGEAGGPFPAMAYIGRPSLPTVYTQRWEAATSGGRTSLLSTDEQRDFARVYNSLNKVIEREADANAGFARLRALEGVTHPSSETLALARQALSETRMAEVNLRHAMRGARFYAARIGIKGEAKLADFNKASTSAAICLPTDTSRAEVARLTGDPDGAP